MFRRPGVGGGPSAASNASIGGAAVGGSPPKALASPPCDGRLDTLFDARAVAGRACFSEGARLRATLRIYGTTPWSNPTER